MLQKKAQLVLTEHERKLIEAKRDIEHGQITVDIKSNKIIRYEVTKSIML